MLSRDLAREIIKKNKLAERPEFDPVLSGVSPLKSLLALIGIGRDPFSMTPEERVLDAYYDRLTAYAVDKSRVIVVEFQSRDPDLAARVANSIADGYLVLQQSARQEQAKSASQWLAGEIDNLRKKVADAEAKVEDFRSKSSLFVGTNNTTLSNQQMGEVNTQLNNARALKSDAESKARLIRDMLQSGKPIEVSEVAQFRIDAPAVGAARDVARATSRAIVDAARQSSAHQGIEGADRRPRHARSATRPARSPARWKTTRASPVAGSTGLSASLDQLKKQATSTNGQDVQLRALEREAKAQRDLLEIVSRRNIARRPPARTSTPRRRMAASSRAPVVSNTPAYPKKLPIVLIATLATLLLSPASSSTGELLRMTAPRAVAALARTQEAVRREPVVRAGSRASCRSPLRRACAASAGDRRAGVDVTEFAEIEQLAESSARRRRAPRAKVTVLGTASGESHHADRR